ncbi:MAG: hypothetical protein C7B43_18745 [Sulfobacillus benefaciens]|uniref:2-dehydro-3-deoxyphosphogluconate aldolase n=1 Tax=Sulfobacillus benefaciens TaxID=453960 RepID=A0A2T2WQM0_9FIRM|nr:MAG: hypothetical protein C7B43_18745 [Sulfobacillus benefaciens]
MQDAFHALCRQRIVPVIRTQSASDTINVIRSLQSAGMQVIELTTTIPNVLTIVAQCRRDWPDLILAMGTIRTAEQAQMAIDAGISLLITYKVSEEVARCGQANKIPYILGASTPSEVDQCLQLGSPIIKWFPASIGGPHVIQELHGPMPEAQFFPTGGITLDSLKKWFVAGAVAVGIGGDLIRGDVYSGDAITRRAQRALELASHPTV